MVRGDEWRVNAAAAAARRDRTARLRRRAVTALTAAVALCTAGCELATETVASPPPSIVVHAVLNADVDEQVILVENSLTGRVPIDTTLRFDILDPIRTGGGEPLTGAEVRLFEGDDSIGVVAVETITRGLRTGRYAVRRARLAVLPGRRYRLRIRTPDGRVVTGETQVPSAGPGWTPGSGSTPLPDTLDRSTDTLRLAWNAVPDARTYAIRVETPNGPWFLFSDSTRFALSGRLRNFFASGLPAVWYPGFEQIASVAAVDRNFFDYNRSGNDPFGGSGLISSVEGGIGLFGSALALLRREVAVTDRDRLPLDARWTGRSDAGADVDWDLWVETVGTPRSSVSGRERTGARRFLLGVLEDGGLRLATLEGTSVADTAALFTGRVDGATISGAHDPRFEALGAVTLTRRPR